MPSVLVMSGVSNTSVRFEPVNAPRSETEAMAGDSKRQKLSVRVYNALQVILEEFNIWILGTLWSENVSTYPRYTELLN